MKKLILTLIFLAIPTLVYAETVNLSWNANTEPDIAGYKIHVGTTSGTYGAPIDVGNVLTYPLNLNAGTHYITITAYDSVGNESGYSYEIKYVAKIARVSGFGIIGG